MMKDFNEDNIRVAAYYIWDQAGRPEGAEKDCWIRACEQLFAAKPAKKAAAKKAPVKAAAAKKPMAKPAVKPTVKVVAKPAVKPVAKVAAKPAIKVAAKPATKTTAKKPAVKKPVLSATPFYGVRK